MWPLTLVMTECLSGALQVQLQQLEVILLTFTHLSQTYAIIITLSIMYYLLTCIWLPICTSLLFILLFIKSQDSVFSTSYCLALFILLHILLLFLFFYHIYALVLCYFYIILIFYSFALSTERTWLVYISLLIIPCIIYYVTNKETLSLEPWTWCEEYPNQSEHVWCFKYRNMDQDKGKYEKAHNKEIIHI